MKVLIRIFKKNISLMIYTGKLFLMCLFYFAGTAFSGKPASAPNYCNIYGTVYFETKNPKEADYRVYVEDSEGMADVWVYKIEDKLFADKPGLWYVTDKKDFADFVIYIDKNKYLADFSVFFIDVESFAGCNE